MAAAPLVDANNIFGPGEKIVLPSAYLWPDAKKLEYWSYGGILREYDDTGVIYEIYRDLQPGDNATIIDIPTGRAGQVTIVSSPSVKDGTIQFSVNGYPHLIHTWSSDKFIQSFTYSLMQRPNFRQLVPQLRANQEAHLMRRQNYQEASERERIAQQGNLNGNYNYVHEQLNYGRNEGSDEESDAESDAEAEARARAAAEATGNNYIAPAPKRAKGRQDAASAASAASAQDLARNAIRRGMHPKRGGGKSRRVKRVATKHRRKTHRK